MEPSGERIASAFDPKSPSTLLLASNSPSNTNSTNPNQPTFTTFLADDGVGCNSEEVTALLRILDARDEFLSGEGTMDNPTTISKFYRRELTSCIEVWENRLMSTPPTQTDKVVDDEVTSLELLKMTHSLLHLSEIHLLRDISAEEIAGNTAGIVTADTIRYLRWNHIPDPIEYVQGLLPDDMDIDSLMNQNQPEYYDPSTTNSSTSMSIVPMDQESNEATMTPYWHFFRKLVLRGCLEDAWAVLSRHSAVRRCTMQYQKEQEQLAQGRNMRYGDSTTKEDNEAFAWIRALLLSAPLPGGRDDSNDDGLASVVQSDDTTKSGMVSDEDDEWFNGVPLSAYKLWDINMNDYRTKSDMPSRFNIHAAMSHFKSWQANLKQQLQTNMSLRALTRRIPMLQTCLWDILLGKRDIFKKGDAWSEILCSELIYDRPNVRKEDMHGRAKVAMKTWLGLGMGSTRSVIGQVEDIVMSILKGDVAVVIESVHSLGGKSGAALPATVSILFYDLLMEMKEIEMPSMSTDVHTELLLSASSSILSSFSLRNDSDIGMSLSTRLLLPHITPENIHLCAYMVEVLERHWPQSDSSAHTLLRMCQDFVNRGSRRMLDACDSLALTRFIFYKKRQDMNSAIYWLLRGINCASSMKPIADINGQSQVIQDFMLTSCFRHLVNYCEITTNSIMAELVDYSSSIDSPDSSVLLCTLRSTKNIVTTILEDECAPIISSKSYVALLVQVVDLGLNFVNGDHLSSAKVIIKCLQDELDEENTVTTLAHPSLYGHFLSLAFDIMESEDNSTFIANVTSNTPAFDVHGLHMLLTRFTQGFSVENKLVSYGSLREDITMKGMRLALANGLMRAFIQENSKNAEKTEIESISDEEKIEREVESMLTPSFW